jgi:hypothetical protein
LVSMDRKQLDANNCRSRTVMSPSGTTIPPAAQIVDATGGIWTVGSNGNCYLNGVRAGSCSNVQTLLWYGGNIYHGNTLGAWYQWTGSNWTQITADPRTVTSPSGTTIPPAAQIVDATGGTWTVGSNGDCYLTGVRAGSCSNVQTLLWYGGNIYHGNTVGAWYQWTGSIGRK